MSKKILFLDRDGTLIDEPLDQQVDNIAKFKLKANVISALLTLRNVGFSFVMISNQDGLGTESFSYADFVITQNLLLDILQSQGIYFGDILICPHFSTDHCECRKPKLGLVMKYLQHGQMDFKKSWVIGDRETDLILAQRMGIQGLLYSDELGWQNIARQLTSIPRRAEVQRHTKETQVHVIVDLDHCDAIHIQTGIGFFDHMLEQLAKHAGFNLTLNVSGDLHVDEHHTVEDTALALGQALQQALDAKLGIQRYGFLLPMDEALAQVAIDLSGRAYFVFDGTFKRERVGNFPTELVPHFFHSLAESLQAAIHIKVAGDNSHHMVESMFKSVGRALRQAIQRDGYELPTTKGVL